MDLLAAGIEVISTVNIQHLESLNDVVAKIDRGPAARDGARLGGASSPTRSSSSTCRRTRCGAGWLHGNVYPDPAKAELALQRYFTTDNLTALRELALMRVANQVDETLLSRWSKGRTPETRERVLVCVSRAELADDLVRRGARIAQRARGDFLVVHARERHEPEATAWLVELKQLVADLGGELAVIDDEDPVEGVLTSPTRQHVTQIVVGEPLPLTMEGDPARLVREPADPAGVERRHPRHRAARAVIPRGPRPRTIRLPSRRSPANNTRSRVSTTSSPSVIEPTRNASNTTRRSRASSSARSTAIDWADVTGQPTVITTTAIDPATSPG